MAGWCWPQSVLPGEVVALHVDGDAPARVEVAQVTRNIIARLA
jgi:hypothetical protein